MCTFLISPVVLTLRITALVEVSHRFVSRSGLYLHEVSTHVITLGAAFLGGVDVFPGGRTTKYIVNLFQLWINTIAYPASYIADVRTSITGETQRLWAFLHVKEVAAVRAK